MKPLMCLIEQAIVSYEENGEVKEYMPGSIFCQVLNLDDGLFLEWYNTIIRAVRKGFEENEIEKDVCFFRITPEMKKFLIALLKLQANPNYEMLSTWEPEKEFDNYSGKKI